MNHLLAILLLSMTTGVMAVQDFFELPPIKYSTTASQDDVAKMMADLENGDWVVPPSSGKEFLRAVLKKLNVPIESQVLVFSRTSLQNSLISQRNPRALYFSADAYVGWVPGGKVELIVEDEKLGPVFYTLTAPFGKEKTRITRHTDSCLQCHATSRTDGVPGMLIRSVIPDRNSYPILSAGTYLTTDASPLKERWGGWYVTGEVDSPHLGNRWIPDSPLDDVNFPAEASSYKDLSKLIDTSKYLMPTSDVVALMILEHQCRTHNILTKAKFNYLRSRYFHKSLNTEEDLLDPKGMSWKSADSLAKEVVSAFLFEEETTLEGVEGGEKFSEAFLANAINNKKGKSLRDFRLYERIFKNRCSYMIYSKAFKGLPRLVKERVFFHLRVALEKESDSHLKAREKKQIHEILAGTVPGFVQK